MPLRGTDPQAQRIKVSPADIFVWAVRAAVFLLRGAERLGDIEDIGEENTEIIIAAKYPNREEIRYEIADYLYHLMVLMAERGVTWEEITDELARR